MRASMHETVIEVSTAQIRVTLDSPIASFLAGGSGRSFLSPKAATYLALYSTQSSCAGILEAAAERVLTDRR